MAIDASSSAQTTPLHACIVRPESMESEPKKSTGLRIKHGAQRPKTIKRKKTWPAGSMSAKSNKDDNFVSTRKRGRPTGSESAKSRMGRKPALAYSSSSDSEGEREKDDDFDPTWKKMWPAGSKPAKNNKDNNFVPTRKRGRPVGSKSAKSKMGRKPAVRNADGRKKYTRVQGICGPAFKRASKVQEKFPGEYPTFTRCMVPSNVLRVFWLHLSSDFCRSYLPKCNARMTLEDENGQRDYANYLSGSYGLSGGWKRFATDHSLKVGDTVVFQLVMPTKFKVYIRRENESTTTDDDVRSKEDPGVTTRDSSSLPGGADNQASEEAVDDVAGMRSPEPDIENSDGMPSFKNFNIFIDSLLINPELFPDHLRGTYYELCCNQKALLHRHLPKKINPALVIGLIMETTNISKGISAASSREDLVAWKKILESFELLGMDVGFLRKRVEDLLGVLTPQSSTDQQPSVEREGYEEVRFEKGCATEKMKALKSMMAALKDALNAVDVEMEELESSVKKNAQAMQKMANAPW